MTTKTYGYLKRLHTFEERYNYLKLLGTVGQMTFGYDRYLNQGFYKSVEWLSIRKKVIYRDNGCDLGIEDRPIFSSILVHHLNPITPEDILNHEDCLFDLNNLICSSYETHNAIHYGLDSPLMELPTERTKGDTCPWLN